MIDMSLLPTRFREGWVAVCAQMEGAATRVRTTLEMGDLLMPISSSARSLSSSPAPALLVGRNITVADLYPDAWDTWEWAS